MADKPHPSPTHNSRLKSERSTVAQQCRATMGWVEGRQFGYPRNLPLVLYGECEPTSCSCLMCISISEINAAMHVGRVEVRGQHVCSLIFCDFSRGFASYDQCVSVFFC